MIDKNTSVWLKRAPMAHCIVSASNRLPLMILTLEKTGLVHKRGLARNTGHSRGCTVWSTLQVLMMRMVSHRILQLLVVIVVTRVR